MKSKTWIIKLEAEIKNFTEADYQELEDKKHIESYSKAALDFSDLGFTLGGFDLKLKKCDVKLKK